MEVLQQSPSADASGPHVSRPAAGVDGLPPTPPPLPFSELLGLSMQATATVAALAALSAYSRHVGVLTKTSEKVLGELVTYLFLPALILQKVTPNMEVAVLRLVWPLGLTTMITVVFGLLSGRVIAGVLGLGKTMRGVMMVACGFPNSFAVPLTLMLAIPEDRFASRTEGGGATAGGRDHGQDGGAGYELSIFSFRRTLSLSRFSSPCRRCP